MNTIEVMVKLPEELVRDARDLDLLDERLIAQALRQIVDERVNALVNEEVHAYRVEKHAKPPGLLPADVVLPSEVIVLADALG